MNELINEYDAPMIMMMIMIIDQHMKEERWNGGIRESHEKKTESGVRQMMRRENELVCGKDFVHAETECLGKQIKNREPIELEIKDWKKETGGNDGARKRKEKNVEAKRREETEKERG